MKKLIIPLVGTIVLLVALIGAFFAFNNYIYNKKQGDIILDDYYNQPTSATPRFEEFAVDDRDALPSEGIAVDLSSSPLGETFPTVLTEAGYGGTNFAGSYIVAEWGCGTMCAQFAIIDGKDGKIYAIPWGIQTGLSYRKDSRLLIINPIENTRALYPDPVLMPEWLTTTYYEWTDNELRFIAAFKVVENGIIDVGLHEPAQRVGELPVAATEEREANTSKGLQSEPDPVMQPSATISPPPKEITSLPTPAVVSFTIEADDYGFYPNTPLRVVSGAEVSLTFVARTDTVYYGGLDYSAPYFETVFTAPGESATVTFTMTEPFTITSYWPATKDFKAALNVILE